MHLERDDVMPVAPDADADVLALLEQAAASEKSFPPLVFRWFRGAVRRYIEAAGKKSLDECAGLKAEPGERTFARRLVEAKRNAALVRLWRSQTDCEALSNWRRAELIALDLAEFGDSAFLAEWKITGGPPSGTSELRGALFEAWVALDTPPATSTAGVYESLKRAGVLA